MTYRRTNALQTVIPALRTCNSARMDAVIDERVRQGQAWMTIHTAT